MPQRGRHSCKSRAIISRLLEIVVNCTAHLHPSSAIHVQVPSKGAAPSGEREKRQGNWNGNIDAHLRQGYVSGIDKIDTVTV